MKNFLIFIAVIAIDQATKFLAFTGNFGSFLDYFRPLLGKQLFPNYNFAFSLRMPEPLMYLIYAILLFVLGFLFFKSERHPRVRTFVVIIFSGAISNIFDRLMFGYVRDFVYIFWGNVFNFADLAIVTGLFGLLFKA